MDTMSEGEEADMGNWFSPFTKNTHIRAVARGWAGWAMTHPVFRGFKGKTCCPLQIKPTFWPFMKQNRVTLTAEKAP